MIGHLKLIRMTVIWPTSRKREQGKEGYYRIGNRPHTAKFKAVHNVQTMYFYLLRTLSIQIPKTKLLVNMSSESGRFANLTEEDLQQIIDNEDSKQTKEGKIFMRYSKTNTAWFISRSSKNSWSLGVGCLRLVPSASRQEAVSRIHHLGTSNFYYFPQYHVVFV